jgi:hypothetical protein
MKIAFLHYHLKTGGVTTCLKQQVAALKNDCDMFSGAGIFHPLPKTDQSAGYCRCRN